MKEGTARAYPAAQPSTVEVFVARAEARAMLWAAGELDLHTAVDELWAAAVRDGLVDRLGADEVQRLLADAFAPLRTDLPCHEDVVPDLIGEDETQDDVDIANVSQNSTDDDYEGLPRTFAKLCREADEKQARKSEPTARARRLLDDVAPATLRAANFLIQQKDPARLRAWFAKHTAAERAAILRYLEQKARRK
jgi:hypothetical protein